MHTCFEHVCDESGFESPLGHEFPAHVLLLLLVTAIEHGVLSLTRQGHLRLPAPARRWCGLGAGDRVLLAGDPDQGRLVVHPPAALDAMVGWLHGRALGGDRP